MNINKCLNCNSKEVSVFYLKDYNQRIENKTFIFCLCKICKCITNLNKLENLNDYYSNLNNPNDISDIQYIKIKKKNNYFYYLFKRYFDEGAVLEIGPGYGYFASILKDNSINVDLIEQNKQMNNFYKNRLGFKNIYSNDFFNLNLKENHYNAVVAWQVVEHLENPTLWINKLKLAMKKNSYLFLSTPNANSFQFKIMKKHWPHLDAPRHQIIYNPKSLQNKLLLEGFQLVYENWGIDTILWNRFGWIKFFSNILNKRMKLLSSILGTLFFLIFFPIEMLPGFGSSYIHIYKKIN